MTEPTDEMLSPLIKIVAAWGAIGITSWSDASYFLAACLSFVLLLDWFWKRIWRPLLVRLGILKPRARRRTVETVVSEYDSLS